MSLPHSPPHGANRVSARRFRPPSGRLTCLKLARSRGRRRGGDAANAVDCPADSPPHDLTDEPLRLKSPPPARALDLREMFLRKLEADSASVDITSVKGLARHPERVLGDALVHGF